MLIREKVCPKCNKPINLEDMYCPYDGSAFKYKDIENCCTKCNKQYGKEYTYCPMHGGELINISPTNNEEMDKKSIDLFERSVCPKCDAWNNWYIKGTEFTCKSCNEKYNHTNGKLINLGGGSLNIDTNNTKTSSPYYKILSVIDISNRDHWLNIFEKIENGIDYKKWNWPSFFLDTYWYYWKGNWKYGLIYSGVFWVIIFAMVLIIPKLEGNAFLPLFPLFGFIGYKVYIGKVASNDYYKYINKMEGNVDSAKKQQKIGRVIIFVILALAVIGKISSIK